MISLRQPNARWLAVVVLVILSITVVFRYDYSQSLAIHQQGFNARNRVPLRLMAIGDSLTQGTGSSGDNGYRLILRNLLIGYGRSVDFIGTLQSGQYNANNAHEGHAGMLIKEIHALVLGDGALTLHPNLILLMAGTNDQNQGFMGAPPQDPYEEASTRLEALIDLVLCECPDAVLLLAQIPDNLDPESHKRVQVFNRRVKELGDKKSTAGYKVQIVDQEGVTGKELFTEDGVHPNDDGYKQIAMNWFDAVRVVPSEWITPAREPSETLKEACKSLPIPRATVGAGSLVT